MKKLILLSILLSTAANAEYNIDKLNPSCIEYEDDVRYIRQTKGCAAHFARVVFPAANEATKTMFCTKYKYILFHNSSECYTWRQNK